MTTKPSLRCTKDYSLFEKHPHNRDVTKTKILEQSMDQYGFDDGFPIRCIRNGKGKLKITHGHHRYHVATSKGLPIWFIVASKDIPLFESEASAHTWSVRDYTVARRRAGEQPAAAALKYHEKTGIPLSASISMVGGHGASSSLRAEQMKSGIFKVGDMKHANAVAEVVMRCKECGVSFATNSYFVSAVSKCLFVPAFDAELFVYKVSKYTKLMEPQRGVDAYLNLIERVYNYRQGKNKKAWAFLAHEASMHRKKTFGGHNSA